MRNRPEVLEAMFACFKAGFCLVPLNSRFTSEEVAFHVGDSRARAVLTDREGESVVRDADCARPHDRGGGREPVSEPG